MATVAPSKTMSPKAVMGALSAFWDEQVSSPIGAGVLGLGPEMDSLTAVGVLCELEATFDLGDLPESLIKKGGYKTKDEFVDSLSREVLEYCRSH